MVNTAHIVNLVLEVKIRFLVHRIKKTSFYLTYLKSGIRNLASSNITTNHRIDFLKLHIPLPISMMQELMRDANICKALSCTTFFQYKGYTQP